MADFSILGNSETKSESAGEDLSFSIGSSVAAGSANVKGSWVEFVASTAFDWNYIYIHSRVTVVADNLYDVGIGSAGNEEVIIPNVMLNTRAGTADRTISPFGAPITIPAGSRISIRLQSSTGSNALLFLVQGFGSGLGESVGFAKMVQYGANTADSGGTAIDPGTTINTKGAWTQITASTNEDLKQVTLVLGLRQNAAPTIAGWLFDIAVGASSSEEIIVADQPAYSNVAGLGPDSITYPISIPKGSRIAIRSQCSNNNATDRVLDAVIYGAV